MQVADISMTSMCQGSRMLGMSKVDEHNLESYFRKLVVNNGYEFVIDKLKTLKQHTINKIQDPNSSMPKKFDNGSSSISWNRSKDEPRGPMSVIYRTWSKPTSRLQAIGSLIVSITEDAITPKQYKKFSEGINHNGRDVDNEILPVSHREAVRFMQANYKGLATQHALNGTDLSASLMPAGTHTYSIREQRDNLLSKDDKSRHEAVASMSYALDQQWQDAPLTVKKFIKNNFASFKDIQPTLNAGKVVKKEDLNPRVDLNNNGAGDYYAGTMSVLQKPGGKLRTVFNTNRVINYALTPYGNALEDAFYKEHPHHIFVERQDKGLQSIQRMVKRGHSLVSADLSSATDRLNFRKFTNGLRKSMFETFFSKKSLSMMYPEYYNRDNSDMFISILNEDTAKNIRALDSDKIVHVKGGLDKNEQGKIYLPITERNLDILKKGIQSVNLFEDVAQYSFYSTDLQAPIALKTGQPLGMMGSFQTLTSMNFCMGRLAEMRSHNKRFQKEIPMFATVGDDFVGDESIMDEYSKIVKSCRGKDNHEKALHSSTSAEFLSHLVTRSRIIPMKPRFQLGAYSVYLNAEKSSVHRTKHVYRLDKRTRDNLEILASVGDPVQTGMTTPATSKRRNSKVRNLVQAVKLEMSLQGGDSMDNIELSQESVSLSRDVTPKSSIFENKPKPIQKVKAIHSRHVDIPTQFKEHVTNKLPDDLTSHHFVRTDNGYKEMERPVPVHENEQFSPVTDHYDHHTAKRVPKTSIKESYKQSEKEAEITKKILDYIDNGKDSDVKLPYHKDVRKMSSVVTKAEDVISHSGFALDVPFPSSSNPNDKSNEIDRGKTYQKQIDSSKPMSEDTETEMIKKGLSPDQIICLSDFALYWTSRYADLSKDEKDRLAKDTSVEFTKGVEAFMKNVALLDSDTKHTDSEKDSILSTQTESVASVASRSLPGDPSSFAWQEFHGSSYDSTHLQLHELKEIGPMIHRSSTMSSPDDPDLDI